MSVPIPVHIIWCLIIPTVGSSMLLVLKQDLEVKNGGKVETAVIWWLEEQRSYLCGQGFERLIHGSRILLSIQNNLHFYSNVMLLYQRFIDSVHVIDVNCLLTTSVIWYYGTCNCETCVFVFIFMYSVFYSSTKVENRNKGDCKPSDQNFIVYTGQKFCHVIRSRML